MLDLVILLKFRETKIFSTKSSEVGLFWAKELSPGGVQKLSKSGPSRDASESGHGQNIRISLCFFKGDICPRSI